MDDVDKTELEREREEARKIDTCKQFEGIYLDDRFELADVMTIGLFHFEAGAKQFDVWSEHMIEDLGPEICPHLKEIWLETHKEFLRVSVELEKRVKSIAEKEAKLQSSKRNQWECKETFGSTMNDWILDSFTPWFKKGCLYLGLFVLVVCMATVISVLAGLEGRGTFPIVVFLGFGLGCFYANAKEKRLLKQIDAYLESETANILNVKDEDGINYLAMEGIIQRAIGQLDSEIVKWYSNRDGGSREMRTKIKEAVLSAYRKLSSEKMSPVI